MDGLYKDNDGNTIKFELVPMPNNKASEVNGRPIFDQVLLVHVYAPGSKDSSPAFELLRTFSDPLQTPRKGSQYDRFKPQADAFLSGRDDPSMTGTPLSAWPALDVARVAELQALKVFTVETLAAFPDSALPQLGMGSRELRERAKAFLAQAAGTSLDGAYAVENERLRTELARVQSELLATSQQLTAAQSALAANPGPQTVSGVQETITNPAPSPVPVPAPPTFPAVQPAFGDGII